MNRLCVARKLSIGLGLTFGLVTATAYGAIKSNFEQYLLSFLSQQAQHRAQPLNQQYEIEGGLSDEQVQVLEQVFDQEETDEWFFRRFMSLNLTVEQMSRVVSGGFEKVKNLTFEQIQGVFQLERLDADTRKKLKARAAELDLQKFLGAKSYFQYEEAEFVQILEGELTKIEAEKPLRSALHRYSKLVSALGTSNLSVEHADRIISGILRNPKMNDPNESLGYANSYLSKTKLKKRNYKFSGYLGSLHKFLKSEITKRPVLEQQTIVKEAVKYFFHSSSVKALKSNGIYFFDWYGFFMEMVSPDTFEPTSFVLELFNELLGEEFKIHFSTEVLGRILSKHFPTAENFKSLLMAIPEQLRESFAESIINSDTEMAPYFSSMSIDDRISLMDLLIQSRPNGEEAEDYLERLLIRFFAIPQQKEYAGPGILALRLKYTGIKTIASLFEVSLEELDQLPFHAEGRMSMRGLLQDFQQNYSSLLGNRPISVLWDRVRNSAVVRKLFELSLKHNGSYSERGSSVEELGDITGLSAEAREMISKKTSDPFELYSAILSMQMVVENPIFEEIKISEQVFDDRVSRRSFVTFLKELLASYLMVVGAGDTSEEKAENLGRVFEMVGLEPPATEIKPSDLLPMVSELGKTKLLRFRAALEAIPQIRGQIGSINLAQLESMEERWLNLDPVTELFVNLEIHGGNDSFVKLLEVVKRSLNGDYLDWKFKENKEKQLWFMSDEAYSAWTKPRAKVENIISADEVIRNSGSGKFEEFRALKTRLADLASFYGNQSADTGFGFDRGFVDETRRFLEQDFRVQDPIQAITKFLDGLEVDENEFLQLVLGLPIRDMKPEELDGWTRYIMSASKRGHLKFSPEHTQVLVESARSMRSFLNRNVAPITEGIVASVVSPDARFGLIMGDLVVGAISCLNYRTGGQISKLLSYVIDGNVQIMANFFLKPSDFSTTDDFNHVVLSIANGELGVVHFDGNLMRFTFNVNGDEIVSLPIKEAVRRQVVRVGEEQESKLPALFLGKVYQQSNQYIGLMTQLQKALFNEMEEEMGAAKSGRIHTGPSNNLDGIYADGGAQLEHFTMNGESHLRVILSRSHEQQF